MILCYLGNDDKGRKAVMFSTGAGTVAHKPVQHPSKVGGRQRLHKCGKEAEGCGSPETSAGCACTEFKFYFLELSRFLRKSFDLRMVGSTSVEP